MVNITKLNPVAAGFSLRAPQSFISRINLADPNDPILLQILPQDIESQDVPGFTVDPLEESSINNSPVLGLIHKYYDRVLLQVTDECAINCRFCFRRHLRNKILDWAAVFNYIKNHEEVSEVILSGGDPLILDSSELIKIINELADIKSIRRVRIHSRMPVIMPEYEIPNLTCTRLPIILVIHSNHPNELSEQVANSINKLLKSGVIIYSQSVLLKNINDNADILVGLSERLFEIGVMPYYLHILDKVKGAAHFYVEQDRACQIYSEMQKKLPGYLVPKLVIDLNNKKNYLSL